MRDTPNNLIWNVWNSGGPFVGEDAAPNQRVTVEPGWLLRKGTQAALDRPDGTSWNRGPARYFQRADNSQTELELENLMAIDIDRSVDTDAGTCKIEIFNTKMDLNNQQNFTGSQGASVGQPGYYWPFRGDSANELDLWGWESNSWNDILQPNALIRTYQGYGGKTKTIPNAVTDGNILQTGVWLVDQVDLDAKTGHMTISCRDMTKLLIEQMLYPPLVPTHGSVHYPINYYRWVYVHHPVVPYGPTVYKTGFQELTSTTPLNNGVASSEFPGHLHGDARDGDDPDTFWLSGGHTAANNFEYLQFDVPGTQPINGINLQPYGGNYVVYAHVMVGGTWQGSGADPFMGLPYVRKLGVGWERAVTIDLGGPNPLTPLVGWNAGKVRLTFGHLAKIGGGPAFYKCGVRDINVGMFTNTVTAPNRYIEDISRGHNDSTKGYWLCGSDGGVFTFGDLKFYGSEGGKRLNGRITSMASGPGTGKGYRLVAEDGGVFCFGDCRFKGSIPGLINDGVIGPLAAFEQATEIANGNAGSNGYYVMLNSGSIYAFGSANYHGNHVLDLGDPNPLYGAVAMATCPGGPDGYYTVDTTGKVMAHGAVSHHGNVTGLAGGQLCTGIDATSDGTGYWVCTNAGNVFAFGSAVHHGDAGALTLAGYVTAITRTHTDNGYWLVGIDGGVFAYGDAPFLGSLPEQYNRVDDGNYEDYLDIIKDLLLWSGWWRRIPGTGTHLGEDSPAAVFGNLESTGIYAPDNLTEDFFDKKPVIDVINTIKEIVGYITYCDEIGSFHFHTPNVWSIGNFMESGVPVRPPQFGGDPDEVPTGFTPTMALIDEKKQITSYTVNVNDTDARSKIIIATDDPAIGNASTKSVSLTSQWGGDMLRGIVRPALWVNGKFTTEAIQRTMAELIDLHLFMQQRQGTLTMPANPVIQINDQVQIYERTTSEVYIHYVRGYSSHWDAVSGEYTMTLNTHWMGDGTAWFLTY